MHHINKLIFIIINLNIIMAPLALRHPLLNDAHTPYYS